MSDLSDDMHRQAMAAQKFTRKYFVLELDFSLNSVDELDRQVDAVAYALKGGCSPDNIRQLTDLWGAYLGETIRHMSGSTWVDAGGEGLGRWQLVRGQVSVQPFQAVHDRLTLGAGHHVREFLESAVAKLTA